MVGDFNEVLRKEERIGEGVPRFTKGMEEFRSFVNSMELIDLNCVGGKFTWFKDNGKAFSRIDRFLLSKKLIEDWEVCDQRIDKRDFSDHAPIRLGVGKLDWGPKPFRFNNAWFKHEGVKVFVEMEWKKLFVTGRGDFVLYEKLKSFKENLKGWNREIFGWVDLKMEEARDSINMWDKVLEEKMGGDNEVRDKDATLLLRWKERRVESKELQTSKRRFMVDFDRPVPEGLCFKRLEGDDVVWMEREFSEVEIKEAVWSCDGDKSPSPDGYSLEFFKLNWEILKEDVFKCVRDFHEKGKLTKACAGKRVEMSDLAKALEVPVADLEANHKTDGGIQGIKRTYLEAQAMSYAQKKQ
ncbi:uncharacterized protein LOC131635939 [Vicia villosa]|uniref:uncharacterized protein LOC131635939 n=1 Tax=Vicia villosa TaxID=3911 RepID=UPI00273BB903|nr:uncharacterized protein LOC131635939 [Vicia villosa]